MTDTVKKWKQAKTPADSALTSAPPRIEKLLKELCTIREMLLQQLTDLKNTEENN